MIKRKLLTLFALATIFIINAYANETVYFITIQGVGNELSLISLEFAEGPGPNYNQLKGNYKARILSFKNQELLAYNISVNEQPIIERPDYSNRTLEELQNNPKELITLIFPYYNNAKKIEILDETGNLKLEIDLSSYARCNENDFCDFNEDIQRCPEDCRKEVVIEKPQEQITEEVKEPTPAAPEETVQKKTLLTKLEEQGISQNLLIIIAVLAIILILILVLSRKKENK